MEFFKNKKIIGISIMFIIIITISVATYGKNKSKVFKDEYMKGIFVEEEEKTDDILINKASNENSIEVNNDNVSSNNTIIVEIKGEVLKPDVYILPEESVVKDLIDMAGGVTQVANLCNINRAKKLQNHELIVVPNINEDTSQMHIVQESSTNEEGLISINNSTEEQLKTIPGIGEVKAKSIIEYREKNNGFKSIDEIKKIDGIGDKTFEKIKEKITL